MRASWRQWDSFTQQQQHWAGSHSGLGPAVGREHCPETDVGLSQSPSVTGTPSPRHGSHQPKYLLWDGFQSGGWDDWSQWVWGWSEVIINNLPVLQRNILSTHHYRYLSPACEATLAKTPPSRAVSQEYSRFVSASSGFILFWNFPCFARAIFWSM